MKYVYFFSILLIRGEYTYEDLNSQFNQQEMLARFGGMSIDGQITVDRSVVGRRLFSQPSNLMTGVMICPDGITTCLALTQFCKYCFCYLVPFTQVIFGTKVIGANGECIWSSCQCSAL